MGSIATVFRLLCDCLFEMTDRQLGPVNRHVREAKIVMSPGISRVERNRLPEARYCFIHAARVSQHVAEIVMCFSQVRVVPDCVLKGSLGIGEITQVIHRPAQRIENPGILFLVADKVKTQIAGRDSIAAGQHLFRLGNGIVQPASSGCKTTGQRYHTPLTRKAGNGRLQLLDAGVAAVVPHHDSYTLAHHKLHIVGLHDSDEFTVVQFDHDFESVLTGP